MTGLTYMVGDREFQRLFVANRQGNVYIYDISSSIPNLIHVMTTQLKGAIRGMQIDTQKNYVFTGGFDDGEIGVFDIEKPGRVIKKKKITQNTKKINTLPSILQIDYR